MNTNHEKYPLVSIISVNFNNPGVTSDLLKSLRLISYQNIEIIIVDNGSTQGKVDLLKIYFSEIILLKSIKNLGFAGGNNLGITQSKGKYILLLNNDIEVKPDFLEPLVAKLESDESIGAVSPKINFFYSPETIQFAGQAPMNNYTMRSYGYGYKAVDQGQFDKDSTTHFLHGAAMMIPRSVIQKVGLMPDCYFLFYEELDWCSSIKRAGFQLWYVHNSTVLHKESMSVGKMSLTKTYYMNRSRLIYLRRNVSGLKFLVALFYLVFVSVPKNSFTLLLSGKFGHFKAYMQAIIWHVIHLFSKEIHTNPRLNYS
jgi:GT2 family glycosyltransferase